jgi:hypothetical protein
MVKSQEGLIPGVSDPVTIWSRGNRNGVVSDGG